LNKWLIGHIMTHDLRFGNWYGEHLPLATAPVAAPAPVVAGAQRGFFARLFGLK